MTLADCKEGESATITSIVGTGAIRQRLLDMGITKGTLIRVERHAPLRDPLHIKVKGYSLALRMAEAKMIEVESV